MKFSFIKASLFLVLLLVFSISCKDTNSTVRNEVRLENEPLEESIRADWNQEKEALRTRLVQTQTKLDNMIESLQKEIAQATDNTKEDLIDQLKNLKQRKNLIETDLEKIETRVADNWDEFKANVGEHIEDAGKEIKEDI